MSHNKDLGALLLRLALAVLFLAHAGMKLFIFTPAGTEKFFASLGLPPITAYFILILEVLGAVSLVLGVYSRWFSLLLAADLLGAIVLLHGHNGFWFTAPGGGWEYPAFWAVALIVQVLIGDGAYALKTKENHHAA